MLNRSLYIFLQSRYFLSFVIPIIQSILLSEKYLAPKYDRNNLIGLGPSNKDYEQGD